MQSGAPFVETQSLSAATQQALDYQHAVGCNNASPNDILKCLKSLTVPEILKISFDPQSTVDNYELLQHPYQTVKSGSDILYVVPFLQGNVRNEGTAFVSQYKRPMDETMYQNVIKQRFQTFADKVLAFYPCASYNASDCAVALAVVYGDIDLICPGVLYANALQQKGKTPVFGYVYSHIPYYNSNPFLGAYHSCEIEFVFSTISNFRKYIPEEVIFANNLTAYWTSFGRNNNPNHGDLFPWPMYTESQDYPRVDLDFSTSVLRNYNQAQCGFWKQLYDVIYNY